jgi:hypothetical protein
MRGSSKGCLAEGWGEVGRGEMRSLPKFDRNLKFIMEVREGGHLRHALGLGLGDRAHYWM